MSIELMNEYVYCLQFDAAVADVVEELCIERHEVGAGSEEQRVFDHVGIKTFFLILQLFKLKCTCKDVITHYKLNI